MFGEFSLPPQPPPMRVLRDCLRVTASRDESKFVIDPEYAIEGSDTPGRCEADAIFRVFEGKRAPAPPLTDVERADLERLRRPVVETFDDSYDDRVVFAKDVLRVCEALVEPERVDEEVVHFLRRFGMVEHLGDDDAVFGKEDGSEEKDENVGEGTREGETNSSIPKRVRRTSSIKRQKVASSERHRQSVMETAKPLTLREFKHVLQLEASTRRLNRWDVAFLLFEDPTSSTLSLYVAMAIMTLILVSSFGGVFETLPVFLSTKRGERCTEAQGCMDASTCDSCQPELNTQLFRQIEVLCTAVFTVEYVLRLGVVGFSSYGNMKDHVVLQVVSSKGHFEHAKAESALSALTSGRSGLRKVYDFVRDPMNLIDAVAIVPFYVDLVYSGDGLESLNVVRLLRTARVFRMTKSLDTYRNWVLLLTEVIADSMSGLQILAFVFFLGLVLFASLLFFTEQGAWQPPPDFENSLLDDGAYESTEGIYTRADLTGFGRERSTFSSIPRAMWFVVVTGPTTGFGDMYPTTRMGKCIATLLVLGTMLVLAFPVTIIAKNMNDKYIRLMNQEPPPEPYSLASMVRRQHEVEAIGREVTNKVTSMRDAFLVDDDDACWIASQVRDMAERYSESRQSAGHWDSCMMAVLAVLQRQPECSEKNQLRKLILLFAEASLM